MPSCIVGLLSGIIVLINILGAAPALCGLSVMFLCLCVTLISGYSATLFSAKDLKAGDARLSVMREIIDSITPVKFMCWEEQYLNMITPKRSEEMDHQMKFRVLMLVNIGIGKASPVLGACTASHTWGYATNTKCLRLLSSRLLLHSTHSRTVYYFAFSDHPVLCASSQPYAHTDFSP